MTCSTCARRGFLTVLLVSVSLVGSVQAQSSANGTSNPYWGTSPQTAPRLNIAVPGMNPSAISNSSRSGPTAPNLGSGLGGGYLPSSITSIDLRLPRIQHTEEDNKAHIWLHVPENADVWFEGVKTTQTGETRYYYSPPLAAGKKYSYQMRIRWMKDGKPVEEKQQIIVKAGDTIRRDFTRPTASVQKR